MTARSIQLPARYYRTFPVEAPLGYAEEVLSLDPRATALLLIDVYGLGFGGGAPPLGVPPIVRKWLEDIGKVVTEHIVPVKQAARGAGIPVIYLSNHLSQGLTPSSELAQVSRRSDDIDLLEAWREPSSYLAYSDVVAPQPEDFVVKKQYYSGFFGTGLEALLRQLGTRNLIAVGFESRVCLGATLTDAMYRDYKVVAIRDAIATREEVETAAAGWANFLAVRFIEDHLGFTCTTEQWVKACGEVGPLALRT